MSDDEGFDLDDEVVYQGRKATVLDVGDEIMIEMLDDGDVLEVDPTELQHFEPVTSDFFCTLLNKFSLTKTFATEFCVTFENFESRGII